MSKVVGNTLEKLLNLRVLSWLKFNPSVPFFLFRPLFPNPSVPFFLFQRIQAKIYFALLAIFFSSPTIAEDYYWILNAGGEQAHHKSYSSVCVAEFPKTGLPGTYSHAELLLANHAGCYYRHENSTIAVFASAGRQGDGCSPSLTYDAETGECVNKNAGAPGMCADTNPVNIFMGSKFQEETSYNSRTDSIDFGWTFNVLLGESQWRHSYQSRIKVDNLGTFQLTAVSRADGSILRFKGTLATGWSADANIEERLEVLDDGAGSITGWQLHLTDDTVEEYDASSKLLTITDRAGHVQTLNYDLTAVQGGDDNPDTLDQVSDDFGNSLFLTYDANDRIQSMIDSEDEIYTYTYDTNGMLSSVTYPDDTPSNATDNPKRIYHYEDANFPKALTGISDENGNRFATWGYDAEGRVISSEHANGVDNVTLDYTYLDDEVAPRVTVTNELGKDTTYHYTTIHGVRKVTQVEGHASDNCAAANQSYTYDENGFKNVVTDWEGNKTDYDHDARGLEVQRIEAKGSAQERTITTEWHTDFRLPTKITEPDRVIEFSYDTQGLLLERKEMPVAP